MISINVSQSSQYLDELDVIFSDNKKRVKEWFDSHYQSLNKLLYTSVDIRNAGYKIAPVDTNLFPAGFNNFSEASIARAVDELKKILDKDIKILLIPEEHDRNEMYLKNVVTLLNILTEACAQVVCGTTVQGISQCIKKTAEGHGIILNPLIKKGQYVETICGFRPDLVVLNNDIMNGLPDILQNIKQEIYPTKILGWDKRTKSGHFSVYSELADSLSELLCIDSWLISTFFAECKDVDFRASVNLEKAAESVDSVLSKIKQKYSEHSIKEIPYAFIKANQGTYGMGVLPIFSGEDVLKINKKGRKKLSMTKGRDSVTNVIIQEGVYTVEKYKSSNAERFLYLIGGEPVSSLIRVSDKPSYDNFNSIGTRIYDASDCSSNMEYRYTYEIVSRLAALAAAKEQQHASTHNLYNL